MRRISAFVVAALLCCSLPVSVSAESFLSGGPSFGGWSCAPAHKANCSVAGKLGYLGYPRGLVFEIGPVGTPVRVPGVTLEDLRQEFPVEGIWLGASVSGAGESRGTASCDPGDPLCLRLGGSWLIPNNKEGSEQYLLRGEGLATSIRAWRPNIQWYTLEASLSRCVVANFSLIGGFRYDAFATRFSDPSSPINAFITVPDEGELILSSYIPYVGAVTRWGGVQLGVIGFPWVPGNVTYRESFDDRGRLEAAGNYRNSYFLEAFAEFGRQMRAAHLSVFAMYTLLHAVGEFDASFSAVPGFVGGTQTYAFGIDRQNWIVGGKAVVGFASPI